MALQEIRKHLYFRKDAEGTNIVSQYMDVLIAIQSPDSLG